MALHSKAHPDGLGAMFPEHSAQGVGKFGSDFGSHESEKHPVDRGVLSFRLSNHAGKTERKIISGRGSRWEKQHAFGYHINYSVVQEKVARSEEAPTETHDLFFFGKVIGKHWLEQSKIDPSFPNQRVDRRSTPPVTRTSERKSRPTYVPRAPPR
ncbi:hypothetical protein ZHAS_00010520 [Anopheles sinensis]|uniref:Uncharacterized protein n=1 Tax=Anopheles sinensis TaxID=74873 RepID=A0A084VXT0_ANOSI|nr:hypothetical protein ZHAS_00010520 [Anopheles sinensis]